MSTSNDDRTFHDKVVLERYKSLADQILGSVSEESAIAPFREIIPLIHTNPEILNCKIYPSIYVMDDFVFFEGMIRKTIRDTTFVKHLKEVIDCYKPDQAQYVELLTIVCANNWNLNTSDTGSKFHKLFEITKYLIQKIGTIESIATELLQEVCPIFLTQELNPADFCTTQKIMDALYSQKAGSQRLDLKNCNITLVTGSDEACIANPATYNYIVNMVKLFGDMANLTIIGNNYKGFKMEDSADAFRCAGDVASKNSWNKNIIFIVGHGSVEKGQHLFSTQREETRATLEIVELLKQSFADNYFEILTTTCYGNQLIKDLEAQKMHAIGKFNVAALSDKPVLFSDIFKLLDYFIMHNVILSATNFVEIFSKVNQKTPGTPTMLQLPDEQPHSLSLDKQEETADDAGTLVQASIASDITSEAIPPSVTHVGESQQWQVD